MWVSRWNVYYFLEMFSNLESWKRSNVHSQGPSCLSLEVKLRTTWIIESMRRLQQILPHLFTSISSLLSPGSQPTFTNNIFSRFYARLISAKLQNGDRMGTEVYCCSCTVGNLPRTRNFAGASHCLSHCCAINALPSFTENAFQIAQYD